MPSLRFNKPSYRPGEMIELHLDLSSSESSFETPTQLSINVHRCDVERSNFTFGFGAQLGDPVDGVYVLQHRVPDSVQPGLHMVSSIAMKFEDENDQWKWLAFEPAFMAIIEAQMPAIDEFELRERLQSLSKDRFEFENRVLIAEPDLVDEAGSLYRVVMVGVGCLLHNTQVMEGYSIVPLGVGLSYKQHLEKVNTFLSSLVGVELEYSEEQDHLYGHSTPLLAVDFRRVRASNADAAVDFCYSMLQDLLSLLSLLRGQKATHIATVTFEYEQAAYWYSFHFPSYIGNKSADPNPSEPANQLERFLPIVRSDRWAKLLLETFVDASNERDRDFRFLRLWATIELVAKREVVRDDEVILDHYGNPIVDENGAQITTKHARPKVYQHIMNRGGYKCTSSFDTGSGFSRVLFGTTESDSSYEAGSTVISIWDLVTAAYEVRNQTAHTGSFDLDGSRMGTDRERLAARLYEMQSVDILSHFRHIVERIIMGEILSLGRKRIS